MRKFMDIYLPGTNLSTFSQSIEELTIISLETPPY